MMTRSLPRLLLVSLLAVSTSHAAGSIDWNNWERAAFDSAKAQNKLILVNVGMEGCAACARMEALTYSDEDVIARIDRDFIAIAVDSEARPDIGERYSDWAWPATIFLAPDATQIFAVRGNRLPRNFIPILDDLVARQASGTLAPDPESPLATPPEPVATDLTRIRDQVRAQLDRQLNRRYGGWSRNGIGRETSGSRLRQLYLRAHLYDDPELLDPAIKGSAGFLATIDRVWGGAYNAAFPPGVDVPDRFAGLRAIPEKRIRVQANAITAFAIGYRLTGDDRYLQGIRDIDRFMKNWMMADDGTFFSNQRAEPPGLARGMTADDYWALATDAERRKYGVPPIDHAVYTDRNGEMIAAYLLAYESTDTESYLATARRAAEALLKNRLHPDGWMIQARSNTIAEMDGRLRPLVTDARPFLSAQAWFGTALLSLYRVTAEDRWLEAADRIGRATLATLHDEKAGGFLATVADATSAIIASRKPVEANGTAASFYYDLWVYTKNDAYRPLAEETIRAVGEPRTLRREGKLIGEYGLALEKVTAAYVEFSIVGDRENPQAAALFAAGRAVFEPRKALHYEAAGRYPARSNPAMYICNPDMCSLPIEDPADVAVQAAVFHGPATSVPPTL